MKTIEILGASCGKCKAMEETARVAAGNLGLECEIVKVTDPMKFIDYAVTAIPTLVIDGAVIVSGRVPVLEEMEKLLNPTSTPS
jgi:small redox-active disulfide protein 2